MRILQLCHKIPFPPSDGGSIAMDQVTQGLLKRGVKVKVMAIAPGESKTTDLNIPEYYRQQTSFEALPVNTRVRPWPAFLNLFRSESYNISRFYCNKAAKRIAEVLTQETFDIIQLEGLFVTPYIPVIRKHTGAPLIFRSHNIEHFIWERMARCEKFFLKRHYLRFLASRLKAFEMRTVHLVDGLVAISPVDLRFFKGNGFSHPAITVPVGIDAINYPKGDATTEANSVFHLGSMDWRPNQEGLKWFMKEVWPLVIKQNPSLHFYLAGKNIPESFYGFASGNLHIEGEVKTASEFIRSKDLMVVPLHSGGGMRVKIIEGMAAGKPIISTSIGAEGINCVDGKHLLLADTPAEMAEAILSLNSNPSLKTELSNNAKAFAEDQHSIEKTIDILLEFYKHHFYLTNDER